MDGERRVDGGISCARVAEDQEIAAPRQREVRVAILKEEELLLNVQDVFEGADKHVVADLRNVLGQGQLGQIRIVREGAVADLGDLSAMEIGREDDRRF